MKKKEKKKSSFAVLMHYAGGHKYYSYASAVLAVISAWIALIPFYDVWRIIKEILRVRPDFSKAENISRYGWEAVGFALLGMVFYIAALMCSHKAAFRVQANMRVSMMKHIMKLPLGYVEAEGTGKIRKIVMDSSASTETYLAHNFPDKAVSMATPVGLLVMMFIFDWRLGLISLIPAFIAFVLMGTLMMGPKMAEDMKQYQNALEKMSSEAVEYVRGIPVVKTFGQTIFSFKRFKLAIDEYEKWTLGYTKNMMLPMICEYAAYHFIAVTGTLRVCKIINPFFYWDMRQALGSYVNFNFGGHAIGKNEVAVSVFLIIYVVCCASGINLFHRTCQISDSGRLETLIIRLRKKWSVLGHRRNLVYYEFYKLLIQQKKGIVIIIALWLMMQNVFAVYAPQYYATAKDAAYHMYLKNLSGQLTEETLEQVENEKRRLEQLQEPSRESAEMSGTDEIDRLLMQLEWQRLHEGFQELTDQIRGLSEKEGKLSEKYLLDEKAYLDIWGNVTHEVLTWYVGAVLLLFLLGGIYGAGEESNLIPLIRSTRRGREVLERSKDLAAIICVVFVYLVMAAPLFLKLQNIDGFATAGQKMCNLVNWNCESSITLGWYETFVFVLKFGSFLAVGILGRTLYKKLKQRIPALLMGSGILIIVVLLLLYFKRSSHMILLNMI